MVARSKAAAAKRPRVAVAPKKTEPQREDMTLLEQEAQPSKSTSTRRPRDQKAVIIKILNDNFKGLSSEAKFVVKRQGLTLEERLTKDRAEWDQGRLCMGKNYYKQRRMEYEEDEAPAKRIKVPFVCSGGGRIPCVLCDVAQGVARGLGRKSGGALL